MGQNGQQCATKHILLLGPPASGKGTQARQLAVQLDLPCLGTGKLLRNEIKRGSAIGKEAANYINDGLYVPDKVIMKMVKLWMGEHQQGWILDGFPRTLPQAEALQEMTDPDIVIALDVPQDALEFRITKRRECVKCGVTVAVSEASEVACPECDEGELVARKDDALDSFRVRYKNYTELTGPMIEFYENRGMVQHVDGTKSPAEVFESINEIITNHGQA